MENPKNNISGSNMEIDKKAGLFLALPFSFNLLF
jgi:hypothetical protein